MSMGFVNIPSERKNMGAYHIPPRAYDVTGLDRVVFTMGKALEEL